MSMMKTKSCVGPASGERTRPRVRPLAPSPKASSRLIASQCEFRGAHASRVLALASRQSELPAIEPPSGPQTLRAVDASTPEVRPGGMPRPTSGPGGICLAPKAQLYTSLVCCNTITFALQEWRWSRVGLPINASASWSAGSPLPLSQAGQSFAYGSFPLPSELSASLRQRLLRLELTPDVARRTAKAVEDYPHSKTLARLPSPSRFFALCHRLAIRTGHCYSVLGYIVVAPLALNGSPQPAGSLAACEGSHGRPVGVRSLFTVLGADSAAR